MSGGIHIANTNYAIHLEGNLLDNASYQLIGFSVTDSFNRIPKARLEINYHSLEVAPQKTKPILISSDKLEETYTKKTTDFLPGNAIRIDLGYDENLETVFEGYIAKQSFEATNSKSFTITIDCKHNAYKMTLQQRTRLLHHKVTGTVAGDNQPNLVTDAEALEELLNEYDLGLQMASDATLEVKHENLIQYNCSDWDFLVIRAENLGYLCKVSNQEIHLEKPCLGENLTDAIVLGENLLSFEAEHDASVIKTAIGITKGEFDDDDKAIATYESSPTPNDDYEAIQGSTIVNHGGDLEESEMKAWVEGKQNRQSLNQTLGTAKILGTTTYNIGDTTTIEGFTSIWSDPLFISGIKHELRNGAWYTHLQCGLSAKSHTETFNITPHKNQFFLPPTSGLLFGKVVGYKTGRDGNELIEVKMATTDAFDQSGQPEKTETVFARMLSPMASEEHGFVFRPLPNDEVALSFINNDPRFPIILGALYNKKNAPGFKLNDQHEQEEVGIKIGDWKINIHEKDKTMVLSSPENQSITIKDNENITMAYDDQSILTIAKGEIELKADNINLVSKSLTLEGSTEVKIKSNSGIKQEATTIEIEGKASGKIKAPIVQIN